MTILGSLGVEGGMEGGSRETSVGATTRVCRTHSDSVRGRGAAGRVRSGRIRDLFGTCCHQDLLMG